MKKLILAAAAAAAVAVSATPAAAQNFGPRGQQQAARHDDRQANRNVQVNRNVRDNRHAQTNRYGQANRYAQGNRYGQVNQQRRWQRGERFDRNQARNYQVIQRHNRLQAAPRGHQWVRSGDDAVLVAIGTGIIAALIANLF